MGMMKLFFEIKVEKSKAYIKKIVRICLYYFRGEEGTLASKFKKRNGYKLNIETPETLNEKIQWLKIHDRKHLQTVCADKLAVRDFIRVAIGEEYLIPLLAVYENEMEINSDTLPPPPFILKSNHNSGDYEIIKSIVGEKKIEAMRKKYAVSLIDNFYYRGGEWQYKNIRPVIIAEKLLVCRNGKIPSDYKIHCFNGKAKIVYLSHDREGEDCRNIYDSDWKLLPFTWGKNKNRSREKIDKPDNLKEMLLLSEKIARAFKYVRVDFYDVDGKIYFGEITFHQGSGFDDISPKSWDRKMGGWLEI